MYINHAILAKANHDSMLKFYESVRKLSKPMFLAPYQSQIQSTGIEKVCGSPVEWIGTE
jgi:hypothetical protein